MCTACCNIFNCLALSVALPWRSAKFKICILCLVFALHGGFNGLMHSNDIFAMDIHGA